MATLWSLLLDYIGALFLLLDILWSVTSQWLVLIFLTHQICEQGAVGLAIWVPSVTKQTKEIESSDKRGPARGYTSLSPSEHKDGAPWRFGNDDNDLELSEVVNPSDRESNYEDNLLEDLKVLISPFLKPAPPFSLQLVIYPNEYTQLPARFLKQCQRTIWRLHCLCTWKMH